MFKTILVPIDVSAPNVPTKQLAIARRFATDEGSKIVLLTVTADIPGYVASYLPSDVQKSALTEAKASLNKLAKENELAEDAEVVLRQGQPSRTILDYAAEIGADLIVIASHDPDLSDYLLGSTAARVVRHAHCSVFIVRNVKE